MFYRLNYGFRMVQSVLSSMRQIVLPEMSGASAPFRASAWDKMERLNYSIPESRKSVLVKLYKPAITACQSGCPPLARSVQFNSTPVFK